MKKYFLTIIVLSLFTSLTFSQETKKVLFIGNSYTGVNNLPNLISDIASSIGDTLVYESSTPGGYTFESHSTNTATLNLIASEKWDYVVLQEQSQRPSFSPSQVANEVLPYAQILVDLILENDSCTIPLFYMTWGRKNGDQVNCQFYPPICTYDGMQQRLRESYLLMAQQNDAEVAPVGAAWQQVRINNQDIELYSSDESHPSIEGSYLAACVFYSSIFQKSPFTTYIPANVLDIDATYLQGKANEIVFDSLDNWFIDTTTVYCNFAYDPMTSPVQFSNHSQNADSYIWDFDDGTISYEENPAHDFAPGLYEVTLISQRGCDVDSFKMNVEVAMSVNELGNENSLILFPNPANDFLNVTYQNNADYYISDVNGKVYLSGQLESGENQISTRELPKGVYLLNLTDKNNSVNRRFIIQ